MILKMEVYTSDSSDTEAREMRTLDFSRRNLEQLLLSPEEMEELLLESGGSSNPLQPRIRSPKDIEVLLLNHNRLTSLPSQLRVFTNIRVLDLSSNRLKQLPEAIVHLPLVTLVAKNNLLSNESLPKSFLPTNPVEGLPSQLRELNLSGNLLTHFPEQVIELRNLKYLYVGGNRITAISKDIWRMQR